MPGSAAGLRGAAGCVAVVYLSHFTIKGWAQSGLVPRTAKGGCGGSGHGVLWGDSPSTRGVAPVGGVFADAFRSSSGWRFPGTSSDAQLGTCSRFSSQALSGFWRMRSFLSLFLQSPACGWCPSPPGV